MKIYIGYDSREDDAYAVAKYSAGDHDVSPIIQSELRSANIYSRETDALASTEFSITRFLVPFLNGFDGWALFVDCDVLFLADPSELFSMVDDRFAVMCVQHDYRPTSETKMDGKRQHIYPRKNWSSVVLFNCGHPSNAALTPDLVNEATPQYLHRFSWLTDDLIGSIPHEWNWLVGWHKEPIDGKPKLLHFTEGGPWFSEYEDCEYSLLWKRAHKDAIVAANDLGVSR
jgi:hypothetical protein